MQTISILMPLYNKSKDVIASLDSIDSQITQGLFTIELVVVDDCSTDGSLDTVKSYNWKNQIILKMATNQVNSGPAVTLNNAFDLSVGDYVAILDADDLLTSLSLLSRYRALASDSTVDWVSGNSLKMEDNGVLKPGIEFVHDEPVDKLTASEMLTGFLHEKIGAWAPTKLIRREALAATRFVDNMRSSQDYALNLCLLANGYRIKFIDDYVAIYRTHNITQQDNSLYLQSIASGQKVKDFTTLVDHLRPQINNEQLSLLEGFIQRWSRYTLNQNS